MDRDLARALDAIAAAMTRDDAAEVLEQHTAPEYVFTSPAGIVSPRPVILAGLRESSVRFTSYAMDQLDVRTYGDVVVVLGRASGEGENPGGERFSGVYRFTSVWRREGQWRLVAWHASAV